MSDNIHLTTKDELVYNFFKNNSGFVQFRVKAPHDAHIALSAHPTDYSPMYEVFIGGWSNTKSVIRRNRMQPDVVEVPTPEILSADQSRGFWIRWENGSLTVGLERTQEPFLSWTDPKRIPINYIGVCTGWGATGEWVIQPPQGGTNTIAKHLWVRARGGEVPPGSFGAGEDDGEPLYVIRAHYSRGVIPGKLLPSHRTAYIPWEGVEKSVNEYEVLCDFSGEWWATKGSNIPSNALPAGWTEDGEILYVGRKEHEGALTIGAVQRSRGVLSIPYGGKEVTYSDYQILCSKD